MPVPSARLIIGSLLRSSPDTSDLCVPGATDGTALKFLTDQDIAFHNYPYAERLCRRNIEMTPLCNIEVTLCPVRGFREVRRGGVDERTGIWTA